MSAINPLVAAAAALREGDLDRARAALEASRPEHEAEAAEMLGLHSEWVLALLRVRLLRKQSDVEGALAACDALLARHPSSVPALVLGADLAKRCGRYELAVRRLRDVRAYCTYEDARVDDLSLDALESSLGVQSKLRLVAVRAASWFNGGAYAQVEGELERVADRYALVSPAWRRLMALWLYAVAQGGSWKRLEQHAKRVRALDPELASAEDALAFALGKQRRDKAAESAFARAGLAEVLTHGGDPPRYGDWIAHEPGAALSPLAETFAERAAAVRGGAVDLSALLRRAHSEAGELASLIDGRTLGATPRQAFLFVAPACAYEHPGGWLAAVAELLLNRGRLADCVRVFDRAIAIGRRERVAAADLGRMLAVLGGALVAHDMSRASAVLEEAAALVSVEREPSIAAALHLNWGALHMDLGRVPDAARHFARAAKLATKAHDWICVVNLQRGLLDIERGATDKALEKGLGAEQAFNDARQRGAAVALQGLAYLCARRVEESRDELERAQRFLRESDPRQAARVDCYLAVANAKTHAPEEHAKLLDRTKAVFEAAGDHHGLLLAATCRHLLLGTALPDLQAGPIEARLLLRAVAPKR